jgi:hypothetical protein
VADFDGDAKVDLVVTQNGAPTTLFRNTSRLPGVRIRLNGPPENPSGIGAQIRLVGGKSPSPAREVRAGSGYLGQDSAILVMAVRDHDRIHVRWPGGQTNLVTVRRDSLEQTISWAPEK